jgi:magnesium transporter
MAITTIYQTQDEIHTQEGYPANLQKRITQRNTWVWLNITEEPTHEVEPILLNVFGFHPLSVEDALYEKHAPKLDLWDDYLYCALRGVNPDDPDNTTEIDIFLGEHYIVSHANTPIPGVKRLQTRLTRGQPTRTSPTHIDILYMLADEIATDFLQLLESTEEQLELLERNIYNNPARAELEEILSIRRTLFHLRRVLAPQREVMNKLGRGDASLIPRKQRVYFRDVYDHCVRALDLTVNLIDVVSSVRDTYLSVVNNQMNDVMKILALITTLFLPLSFLSGFFGMNFFQPVLNLNGWTGAGAFVAILCLMVGIPIGMYLWMRRKGWFL